MANVSDTARILSWNKRICSVLGIWALQVSNPRFVFFSLYFLNHCIGCTFNAFDIISNTDTNAFIQSLAENFVNTWILLKYIMFRHKCKAMALVVMDIERDLTLKKYKSKEAKTTFLHYTNIILKFIVIRTCLSFGTSFIFYVKAIPLIINALSQNSSAEMKYTLPYRVRPPLPIFNKATYVGVIIYQVLVPVFTTIVTGGIDAFIVSMSLHICGQFAILAHDIKNVFENVECFQREMSQFILRHYRLIRLAKTMEQNFNMLILGQVVMYTLNIGLGIFNAIYFSQYVTLDRRIAFAVYTISMFCGILCYCFLGQKLIDETDALCNAFYIVNWSDAPLSHKKVLHILMVGTCKPLTFTAGKFLVLSYEAYTNILKTAMAYLSLLRNVI